MEATLEKPIQEDWTLKIEDRCDQCGAQAYVHAIMETGDLLFCAHHGGKYIDKLTASAVKIVDERDRLQTSEKSRVLVE
jgi:hypothetical protein